MSLKLVSLLGLVVFIGVAWGLSAHKRLFPWRTVLWGLGLQFIFALAILKTTAGEAVFDFTGRAINKLITFSNEGCQFVFGPLATDAAMQQVFPKQPLVFAVLVTGTISTPGISACNQLRHCASTCGWLTTRRMPRRGPAAIRWCEIGR